MDISGLQLCKVPVVSTVLRCVSNCWKAVGVSSVEQLTNEGFRVYVGNSGGVQIAEASRYVLDYIVYGRFAG